MIRVLPAHNASLWTGPTGNNTYLLSGAAALLIDAGVGHPRHLDELEAALEGAPLGSVLLTHGHPDHAGGLPEIRKRWPGVRVAVPADGDVWLDGALTAIHTPGHAPDHFCYLHRPTQAIFCGDLVRLGGTVVIPARAGGHLRTYLASLRRIRELQPRTLLPGHGPPIRDPVRILDDYLRHRLEREIQVLEALAAGLDHPGAMLPRIYGVLPPEIQRAAEESLLAHLIKLQEDGIAVERDGRWFRS